MGRVLCVLCLLVCPELGHSAAGDKVRPLVLVENGQPKARLILREDADENEKLAAQELNLYLAKMSGVSLSVTTDSVSPGPKVILGAPDAQMGAALRLTELKYGGFVMKRDRDALVLAGNPTVGTLNAVYAFLEDICGVRWYMPTELGESVPRRTVVEVRALDRRVEPRFVNRRNHGLDMSIAVHGEAWRRRLRITSHGLEVPFNRYSHNLYTVFPSREHGQTHPEYYPFRNGRRAVPSMRDHSGWQPCTVNPEVVGLTIRAARRWLDARPRTNFYSVGMNDSRGFCSCPRCRALDVPGLTFRGRDMVSDRYFTFVKAVADATMRTHPDRYITCIAYSSVETLPQRVKLPRNVGVVITQDVAQWHDPEYRRTDEQFAREWARAAGAFGAYEYTGLTWLMPRVYPHLMAEAVRFYDHIGAVAVTNEAYPTWWYAGPQLYLRAKLMWNPKLDTDAVLDDYYRGFFGPACRPMKGTYAVFERCTGKQREGRWFEGLGSVIQQLDLWAPNDLAECRRLLAEAQTLAAGQELFHKRVTFVATGFGWIDQVLEEYWQAQRLERMANDLSASGEKAIAETLKLMQLTRRREDTWAHIKSDPLVSGIYRAIDERFSGRWASWEAYVRRCLTLGMGCATSVQGELDPARLRHLMAQAGEGEMADALRGHLWAAEHPDAANLCRNPGLEDTTATGPAPEGVDWVATKCPPAWSKWAIQRETYARLTWERDGGHSGSRCVRIRGAKNACFIQTLPVKAGERYYCSTLVRAAGSGQAVSQLRAQWKDAEGKWVWSSGPRVAQAPSRVEGWRRLALAFTVPKGVAQAVVLLSAQEQQPQDTAWFDEVRVVRLP